MHRADSDKYNSAVSWGEGLIMLDVNYEQGLARLHDLVRRQAPEQLPEFGLLQSRLAECRMREDRYGQSSNNSAERNEVVYQLIRFANEHFSIQFVDLCRSSEILDSSASTTELIVPYGQSSPLHFDVWNGESEVTVRGIRYSIHELIEVKWAPERSALYQQAKAQQIGTDRMVWLKQVQLRQATPTSTTWRTALEKESRLLDMLEQEQRQGFPRLLDFELEAYMTTLVHTATRGQSWEQFFDLSHEPLNAYLTHFLLRSVISLCEMLKILHNKQFAHRALIPSGILLLDRHRAVLQDIGLAACKYVPGEGPELYRAPEQTVSNRSLAGIGPHTDVYQLGTILYRLLTGKMPVSPSQVLPPSAWNNTLSSELDAVLLQAIVPDVKKRWRTIYDFSSALKKVLS
jgi:hypothetical protein